MVKKVQYYMRQMKHTLKKILCSLKSIIMNYNNLIMKSLFNLRKLFVNNYYKRRMFKISLFNTCEYTFEQNYILKLMITTLSLYCEYLENGLYITI